MLGKEERHVPGERWAWADPAAAGLDNGALQDLIAMVQGRGCIVRYGRMVKGWGPQDASSDIASTAKPVLSTYLMLAIQEGKIGSPDDPIARFEPRLQTLNDGKDRDITWRHLASQTSGYGLIERPGEAYSYNDYATALYYDTLISKVFRMPATELLRTRLAEPLGFEDDYSHEAFGPNDRPGRLSLSVRDLARLGLLYMRNGSWNGRSIIRPDLARMAVSSPISRDTPLAGKLEARMLEDQRSIGGGKSITSLGPGCYSFNWWLNRPVGSGNLLFPHLPGETICAIGHGGKKMMWLFPAHDLIIVWNGSHIGNETCIDESMNHATVLIRRLLPVVTM
ncbi:MAG: beta-lactamase [Paenibacillaceae bacterium]|jgi:CubicO group peptidase (beta-lactamase class C family)|nr:beta-lactamase [Paenibacillaceae bacterium]